MVDVAQDAAGASVRAAALRRLFAASGATGQLLAQVDWPRTPVGPLERWPQSLVTATSICLSSRFPMLIWWGPELVKIYNDAYVPVLGSKHPASVGRPGREVWPEIWDIIGPMLHGVLTEGRATWSDDQLLLLDRHGYVEECYFTFSYSPIHDASGAVAGVFTAVFETTERVVGERRMRLLHGLGAGPAPGDDVEACTRAIDLLATDPLDLPFAGIYLTDPETGRQQLVASCGQAPEGVLPLVVQPASGAGDGPEPGAPWPVPAPGGDPRVVELGAAIPPGPRPRRGTAGPAAPAEPERPPGRQAAVLGLEAAPDTQVGLLVAGLHPQRPLDEQYLAFLRVLARQVATTVAETRAHAAERERAESLAALDAAKTRFFSGVSHELRTPLTLVLGPLERLLADTGHPEGGGPTAEPEARAQAREQDLEIAHRNALRLSRMVDALLDASRLESGRLEPGRDPLDLTALTADLAATFRAAYESAGLRDDVVCEPLPWPVRVDPLMWERVVLNLLSNALKFTERGRVRVHLGAEGPNAVLHVQDTGCGIAAEDQPHLFERFFRARAARSRSIEGTGIGLSLVREIAELHGGGVDVDSRLGEGSTFTVRLPLAVGARPVAAPAPGATGNGVVRRAAPFVEEARRWGSTSQPPALPAQRGSPRTGGPGGPSGAERILVVDDNADLRDHLERLLQPHWRVTTAADGPSALAAARAEPPDLVLSDVMLPGFDGIALLRALREDPRTSSVPVLLVSARAGAEAAVEGLEAGADDYVVKPFSGPELVARVRANLDLARRRAAATSALESARSARRHAERLRGLAHAALLLSAAPTPQAVLTTAVSAARRLARVGSATAFTEARPPTGPAHRIFAAEPADAGPLEVGPAEGGEAGGAGRPGKALRLPLGGHGELDAVPAEGVQLDAGERALLAQLAQLVTDRLHALHLQAQEHAVAERFRLLAEGARDYAIVMLEPDGTVTGWNPGGQHLLGLTAAEAVGTPFPELFPAGEAAELAERSLQRAGEDAQQDWECALGPGPEPGEAGPRWLNVVLTALHDEDHVLTGFAALLRDVTERKANAQALAYQATHDPLTGLVNRTLFLDRLRAELDHRRREARDVVVLFLDLDGFKWINDSLGHEAGDTLLTELAGRLRAVVRPGDSVARFGGDEFAVLCAGEVDEAEAVRVAERVLEVISGPVHLDGRELLVTASIGLAVAGPRSDAEGLVRDADVAMYRAKSAGRNRFELFDPVMRRHALERLETEHALRAALDAGGLEVLFQPIVALDDLSVVSAEALVRWPHGGRSRLPDEFVPLAEETGLIVPLGSAVLERACREAASWPSHAQVDVSVNVSAHQVAMPQLPGVVARALEGSGLPPERLHLEITETALMADVGASAEALSRLVDLGVGVDIDDFGTGYSSLAYLQRLPVSRLKVDRSFVARIGRTASDDALVRMVVQLAHSLGLRVVAEGVETHEQLHRLRAMGCDSAQGFLFCPPVTTAVMVDRVQEDGRLPAPA